jgi:hypothetical protein
VICGAIVLSSPALRKHFSVVGYCKNDKTKKMSKEELLELLENTDYATFFEQLDELGAHRDYIY